MQQHELATTLSLHANVPFNPNDPRTCANGHLRADPRGACHTKESRRATKSTPKTGLKPTPLGIPPSAPSPTTGIPTISKFRPSLQNASRNSGVCPMLSCRGPVWMPTETTKQLGSPSALLSTKHTFHPSPCWIMSSSWSGGSSNPKQTRLLQAQAIARKACPSGLFRKQRDAERSLGFQKCVLFLPGSIRNALVSEKIII